MATQPKTAEEPAPTIKTIADAEPRLANCRKGTKVRLLTALYDNVQLIPAGTEIFWPYDEPPLELNAVLAGTPDTPIDAPVFTDGKPPEGYVDPGTGSAPVIVSV